MANAVSVVEHERELSAPRPVVFDLLLDAKVVRAWLAYEGPSCARCGSTLARVGPRVHRGAVCQVTCKRSAYREIERPSRMVFDVGIRAASGDGPAADESASPNDVRVTMTLTEAGAGTRVTIERDASVSAPPGLPTWARMLDAVEGVGLGGIARGECERRAVPGDLRLS
ncbi:MAG: SRPBCC domain-containing protein [Myxococcales bacterium]|nr:SRPBCC domain-containing protein [Myxococcales bacterium]